MKRGYEEFPRVPLGANWREYVRIFADSEMKILESGRLAACPWDVSCFASVPGKLQHMIRLHGRRGLPYALIDAYFDAALHDLSPKQFENDAILAAIDTIRPNLIAKVSQKITIKTADSGTAALLKIPTGDPVAVARRLVPDANNKLVYIGTIIYPGRRIEIDMVMDRDKDQRGA